MFFLGMDRLTFEEVILKKYSTSIFLLKKFMYTTTAEKWFLAHSESRKKKECYTEKNIVHTQIPRKEFLTVLWTFELEL